MAMLSFDIRSLEAQAANVDEQLSADDAVWEEGDPRPDSAVHVIGRLSAAGTGQPDLGDGDPMEGHVELAVATAVEPVADDVARPDRDRRRAVVAGERIVISEPVDAGGLADDLRCSERPTPADRKQRRSELLHERGDLDFECVDLDGEITATLHERSCDASDEPVPARLTRMVLTAPWKASVQNPSRMKPTAAAPCTTVDCWPRPVPGWVSIGMLNWRSKRQKS